MEKGCSAGVCCICTPCFEKKSVHRGRKPVCGVGHISNYCMDPSAANISNFHRFSYPDLHRMHLRKLATSLANAVSNSSFWDNFDYFYVQIIFTHLT